MQAEQALIRLSALAADFKMGIVDDAHVRDLLAAIVDSMAVDHKDQLLKKALAQWGIDEVDSP